MNTYLVTPMPGGTDGWAVIRRASGEADLVVGQHTDRADAQAECARLVVEDAALLHPQRDGSDTTYQVFQDADAYKVRITRVGSFVQEADGFISRADAESWISQARRLGAIRAGQQKPIDSPYLKVVKL